MKLFGGPIAWRASKQPTVTTSSTEAELLAASEAAKEMIFAGRLLRALQIRLNEPLLLSEEAAKLTTQLRPGWRSTQSSQPQPSIDHKSSFPSDILDLSLT